MKDAPGDDGGDDDAMVSLVVARGIDLVWFLYFAFGCPDWSRRLV